MKNKNFDSISKFSVPQSWIDNAKAVPATHHKKNPFIVFFTGYKKYIAAAAIMVLVLSLSLVVLMMNERPKVAQNNDGYSVVNPTQEMPTNDKGEPVQTDAPVVIETTPDGSIVIRPSETINGSDVNDPTQSPTQSPQKPTSSTDDPTAQPTDIPTDDTTPQDPTTAPWEPPVDPDPPWIEPTEPAEPTEPPEPTDPPTDAPTDEPWYPPPSQRYLVASVTVSEELIGSDKNIYCKVYDPNGRMHGDPNLYSSQHKVTVIPRVDGNVNLYYQVSLWSIGIYDSYRFVYYDSSGTTIAQTTSYSIYDK